jgi:hypothetical protein
MRISLFIASLFIAVIGYAQNPSLRVFEDWNDSASTQNSFQRTVVRSKGIGGSTFYYLCGATLNSQGDYDILTRKMDASGNELWTQTYAGVGNGDDFGADIQIDNVGNVYVCGVYYKDATDSSNAIILKYNSTGTFKWSKTHNGAGSRNDIFTAMQVSGNAIVAVGSTWQGTTNKYDMLMMRVDSSGNQVWVQNWNYATANLNDGAVNLYTSGTKLFVAGGAQSATTTYKYAVLNVKFSDGSILGSTITGGTGFGIDQVTDLQLDANMNIYITGAALDATTLYDIRTVKLDSALNIIWADSWDGGNNLNDFGSGLYLDAAGNVIVTGSMQTTSSGLDYVTLKYNSSGTLMWDAAFDGAGGDDSASCVVVSQTDTNKIYVSGYSYNGSTKDYWTIRYDGAGNQLWDIGFNNLANTDDRAFAIALDTVGNIVVAGQNKLNDTTYTYTTVKYIEKNTMFPQDTISTTSSSFIYTENRGQLFGSDSMVHPEVKYYTKFGSPSVYFMDTAVAYVFVKTDTSSSYQDSLIRVDMKFVGANSDLRIRSMDERSELNNFYYSHIPGGREHVLNYDKLACFNVWNNVDMIYGSNLNGLKYYFICKPGGGGASYASIDLYYDGADSVKVDGSGQLIIYTRYGNIVQPKAAAWQLDANGNYQSLGWQPSYNIVGTNEVKFTGLGSYNSSLPLIIAVDRGNLSPVSILNLDWSTYYGGDYREAINDVDASQTDGSTYYTGWTFSTGNTFPTTLGAYQTVNSGGIDAIAIKVDSVGQVLYATCYGTTNTTLPSTQAAFAGAIAANGNYFIGGHTNKTGNEHIGYPGSQPAGAFADTSYAGSGFTAYDAFFAGFDPAGQLIWATYYGGAGNNLDECIKDMAFDNSGNLYAVMSADTLTPRMTETGAYNDSTLRGGMILKFDPSLALQWATMFSTKSGSTNRIVFDGAGNFYVTGMARDTLLPVVDLGGGAYYDDTLNGTSDAYIAKFNSADSLIWCSYFGGSGTESGTAIEVFSGELYVAGSTTSSDLPFYHPGSSYIDSTYGGNTDIFLTHFKTNGQRLWTTYYGGSDNDGATNMATDLLGNIYITGSTYSSNFPFKSAAFIYSDTIYNGGLTDVILLSFDPQNQLKWASYFGGSNQDDGLGIDIYQNDKMYICGQTSTKSSMNPNFPTQNLGGLSYWQPQMGGVNEGALYNGFISRFSLAPFINVGINEPHIAVNNSSLLVYPNPGEGRFQVLINSDSENRKIEVYNSIGQIIQSISIADGLASQQISINLGDEATGVYFIVLKDDNGICSQKIIKQ